MRPFEGIRVIDVTHVLAGPFAAYQLGVLGADVIKVEHPDDPDQSRGSGTDKALNRARHGHLLPHPGSNKRSITLDLKTERGREILKKLVKTADVFVENYRPGAFEALGLGYERCAAINPRLIYCLVLRLRARRSARHADRLRPCHSSDLRHHGSDRNQGRQPDQARRAGGRLFDRHIGAFALSAALFQRERTGKGQRIDMAMLGVAMMMHGIAMTGYLRNGVEPKPGGNRSRTRPTAHTPPGKAW